MGSSENNPSSIIQRARSGESTQRRLSSRINCSGAYSFSLDLDLMPLAYESICEYQKNELQHFSPSDFNKYGGANGPKNQHVASPSDAQAADQ
jgi:hypothetical protein